MSNPIPNDPNEISLVSACAATSCKFNDHKHCTASEVTVVLHDGKPECGTFTPQGRDA